MKRKKKSGHGFLLMSHKSITHLARTPCGNRPWSQSMKLDREHGGIGISTSSYADVLCPIISHTWSETMPLSQPATGCTGLWMSGAEAVDIRAKGTRSQKGRALFSTTRAC